MTTLNTACYTIKDGAIIEGTLANFTCYIESTTRPQGVGYKYYATTVTRDVERETDEVDENGYAITETVPADVWALAKWATWGGPEIVVREFETEEEANAAAEETYVQDILGNNEITIHLERADAERDLAEQQSARSALRPA